MIVRVWARVQKQHKTSFTIHRGNSKRATHSGAANSFSSAVGGAEFGCVYLFIYFQSKSIFLGCCRKCRSFGSHFCSLLCRRSGQAAGAAGERNAGGENTSFHPKSLHSLFQLLCLFLRNAFICVWNLPCAHESKRCGDTETLRVCCNTWIQGYKCFVFVRLLLDVHKSKTELLNSG